MNSKYNNSDDNSSMSLSLTGQDMALQRPPDDWGIEPPLEPPYDPPLDPPNPSVSLNQVSPLAASVSGGVSIRLTGSGFQPGAAVYFGNSPSSQVIFESSGVLHAVLPASPTAGSVTVSVFNPDGSSASLPGGFTYVATEAGQHAEVIGVSPPAVLENTQSEITIRGRNLIQAYNSGVFALRGPARCQVTFLNTTTSHDQATGLDTIKLLADIRCTPALQPLERMAIQVLADTRPEAAQNGVVQSSKQMFTVLPKSVPVPIAYTANLEPDKPNVVMVSGRNLDGYNLSLGNGVEVALQESTDKFVSGIVQLPENYDASVPLQLSMEDANGVKVNSFEMEVSPMPDTFSAKSGGYTALAQSQQNPSLDFTEVSGQQFIGPTENDNAVFSVNNFGFGGIYLGGFEVTILDLTIILPIINEVHLIPFFDGGGDTLDSPVLAEVGKIFQLRGMGLLVAYRIEVRIHIRVALIVGFYTYGNFGGFYNEFPEYSWGIGSVVLGIRIDIQVLFIFSFLMAIVKPNGQLEVIASVNLTAGIDFTIDSNGRLHFDPEFTHSVSIVGITPTPNNPTTCGNRVELLTQNGQLAVPDSRGGYVAQYRVNEAGECCLPWDYNVELYRYNLLGQQEVVQTGFQTSYCLTAIEAPKIKVELALAYKDSAGNVQDVDGLYRDEPDTDPTKLRNYFLAAKFDNFPANPSFPLTVKVKVDSAALNMIPFPSGTFGSKFDRSAGTTIGQFFEGSLIQSGFEAEMNLNSLPDKNKFILFNNANIIPNKVEVAGTTNNIIKYVPPGHNVTAHLVSGCDKTNKNYSNNQMCQRKIGVNFTFKDLKITDVFNKTLSSTQLTSQLEPRVVNEETFEEYFRVFHEVRSLMEQRSDRAGSDTLGSFTKNLIASLPQSGISSDFLRQKGKNLWELGYNFVQNHFAGDGKVDDRILYFSRLEAMAMLRDVQNRGLSALTDKQLDVFEYSSRGFEVSDNGADVHIGFASGETNKVVVTGFDPFLLFDFGLISNSSGLIASNLHRKKISTAGKEFNIRTAIFPVRFRDFGSSPSELPGLVEKVMSRAVNECDLIMTSSWTGRDEFRIDRFAARYRTQSTEDNEKILSATDNPLGTNESVAPFYLENSLPYTEDGVLKVIVNGVPMNRTVTGPSNPTYVILDQSFELDSVTTSCMNQPEPIITQPDSYEKVSRTPNGCGQLIEGSGGSYLSNEIFYRTSRVRSMNRPNLPTGHLHVPTIGTEPYDQNKGKKVIDGGTEILTSMLPYAAASTPRITSFTPANGAFGTMITIIGENFNSTTDVRIGASILFNVISSTEIQAYVTQNAFTSFIEVDTPSGTASSSTPFWVIQNPKDPPFLNY